MTVYRHANGTWRYVIDLPAGPDGRRRQARRGGFRTRAEAVRAEAGLRAAPPKASSHDTLGVAIDAWLAASEPEWAGSTARWYRDMIKLMEPLRNQYVTPALLERHYQWLLRHGGRRGEGVAAGTVRAVHKTLLQALKFADDRGLDPGYATRTRLPRVERREADAWTPDEARAFLHDTTTERLHALFVLAVHTGMRRGELAGLRWSDVDLDRRSVAIRRQRAYDGNDVVTKDTKGRRARVVEVGPEVATVLAAFRQRTSLERTAWGSAYQDQGWVFCREDGTPYGPRTISDTFERAVVSVGARRIVFHGLRHSAATLMLLAGVPVWIVAARLGHKTTEITETIYAHVIPGLDQDAARRVSELLTAPSAVA